MADHPDPAFGRDADVVLRDGSTVHVRRAHAGDEDALTNFYIDLSPRSRRFRFFSEWADFSPFVEKSVDEDETRRLDLIATVGSPPKLVAHALYVMTEPPHRAEVAFAVDDTYQQRGLGTIMLGQLAEVADARGISTFEASTLPENRQMLGVFRESGFSGSVRALPDEVRIEFPTSIGPAALERFDARDRIAAAAAVQPILAPESIAVIGASRNERAIGGAVIGNLVSAGFKGRLHPVNPNTDEVRGLKTYPSVGAIPEQVELAVIVVPSRLVADVARECAAAGVRALVVISAGFREVGPDGEERQRELLEICRTSGMRLVGPNCFGVLNTDPEISMNATFGRTMPPPGNVALLTQSGAIGLAVIDQADATGLGVSTFVSNGNKADISGNDLLSWWETDTRTDVVLLYLESFGNPRKFARISRHVGRSKPIVAVKSGRSRAGARATSSHTGALIAASDVTVDALFRQSGVIRCDTMPELFDVARLLSRQPVPNGNRVAIVTNAGGPAILCADTCEAEGLDVVDLPTEVQDQLRSFLPAEASVANPVDMIAAASGEQFRRSIETVALSGAADAIIAIYIPPLVTTPAEIAAGVEAAASRIASSPDPIPLIYVFMSPEHTDVAGLPVYPYPEQAAHALAQVRRYGSWRSQPLGEIRRFGDCDGEEAAGILATALGRDDQWLTPGEVARVLASYGIERVAERVVATPDEAVRAATELGFPVALKAVAPGLIHKTDAGAVALDLATGEDVQRFADSLMQRLEGVQGFVVQRMLAGGVEMLVGVVHDPSFGPVVALGAGGITAEVIKDVAVRITPLTDVDVKEMISSLRTAPLLRGYRGAPPADVDALEDVMHRVGALVEAHPEIAEMDLNPVIVSVKGAVVVDARIRAEVPGRRLPVGAR